MIGKYVLFDSNEKRARPALASAYGSSVQNMSSTTPAQITISVLAVGDRFKLASNVLTCYQRGIYEVVLVTNSWAPGTSEVEYGYKIDGGTLYYLGRHAQNVFLTNEVTFLLELEYLSTLDFYYRSTAAAANVAMRYPRVTLTQLD